MTSSEIKAKRIDEDQLDQVTGGTGSDAAEIDSLYKPQDRVVFGYIHTVGIDVIGYFEFVGTVEYVVKEPEGIFYNIICSDEAFIKAHGSNHIYLFYENIVGRA